MPLAAVVRCSMRIDFVTIPTALERCWKDDPRGEQNMRNLSIESPEDLNSTERKKKRTDLPDPIKGTGNAKHFMNFLDIVRSRPGGVDEIHHRDTWIHYYSPGATTLCGRHLFHCDFQCQFPFLFCTGVLNPTCQFWFNPYYSSLLNSRIAYEMTRVVRK